MAKLTVLPMASADSPIYKRPLTIGVIKAAGGTLKNPDLVYDHDRERGELTFLCTVEWSWSRYHERIEAYYVGFTETEYELWSRYNEESSGEDAWCCCVIADRTQMDLHKAASKLLRWLWTQERAESSIGVFDMVSEEGLLDENDVIQIGQLVWPE